MSISKMAAGIGDSVTLQLNATTAALRARGEPVIHLGGGEPKAKTPVEALVAGTQMLATGVVRYTPASGTPAIKEAIVGYTQKFYDYDVKPANVMASGGAKQAIMVALHALVDPGDEVIFPVPYWVSYPDMVRIAGGTPVPVKPADGSFCPQLSDIEAHVTERTKVVLINSPNNPSGAVYAEGFVADIVEYCERREIYLIMDDIYHRLVFDGREPLSCYQFTRKPLGSSKLITINGASKQYAMTGFRIGWAVGNDALIKVMGRIQGHETSGPSALSQCAAVAALNGDQSSVDELRRTLESNRGALLEGLNVIDGIHVTAPEGTFYSFVDFSHYDTDSIRLARYLLEKALVVTVPGVAFGVDGHLRVSFCESAEEITNGLARMSKALSSYKPEGV